MALCLQILNIYIFPSHQAPSDWWQWRQRVLRQGCSLDFQFQSGWWMTNGLLKPTLFLCLSLNILLDTKNFCLVSNIFYSFTFLLQDQQIWWSSKECNQKHWIKVLLKYFANWKSSKVTNNLYWKVLSQKYTCLSFLIFWFSNKMWQFDLLSSFVYVTCSFDHFFKVIICLLYLIIGKNTKNLCLCFNLKSDLLSMYFLIN